MSSPGPFDGLLAWYEEIEKSRRILLCPPEWASKLRALVDSYGVGGLLDVQACDVVPAGQILVCNPSAITRPIPDQPT